MTFQKYQGRYYPDNFQQSGSQQGDHHRHSKFPEGWRFKMRKKLPETIAGHEEESNIAVL